MANAKRDGNRVTTIIGVSSVDEQTPTPILADPARGELFVNVNNSIPTSGANPSTSITESVVGTVTTTTIQKTIGATTYQQTIVSDSSDNSTTISAWSEV